MASDRIQGIAVFVRVAEARSFTDAARRLGMSPSGASKAITRLEDRLGVRLVHRTTRSVSLTDDGAAFFERCRQLLGELEDAETAVTRRRSKPSGRLRIQMPEGFGRLVIVPLLARFVDANPELVVDAELSDRVADLADEGLDAAVRIGELGDARLIARRLCDLRFVTVASPDYLARHGAPRTPDDLAHHRCLAYYLPHTHRYREWEFVAGGERFSRPLSGPLNVNNAQALLDAATAGAGIANVATFIAHEAIRAGRLRVVLREYVPAGPPVWVVYLERRHLSPRVQALVAFLTAQIPPSPPWDAVPGEG
ncbi:MAG TPA: LysR family transcriptional regulator [Burkholderiales bacterium]|nr:LysR family transcriptional regulator [Burkholderiales bacterium]